MKLRILILGAALCIAVTHTRAGIPVIDPTNLVQNTIGAVQGVTTATNVINSFKETVKIYRQAVRHE